MVCQACSSSNVINIYSVEGLPIFQNKTFQSVEDARNYTKGRVSLIQCLNCGFIFNSEFDNSIMSYDSDYQNEQANSIAFNQYLDNVIDTIFSKNSYKKVVEIGCGKGTFLKKLWDNGIDAYGFDPAYEGNDNRIIKDYYSEQKFELEPDLIILRHVLEHIEKPLDFLQTIQQASGRNVDIYIEVPAFDWIQKNNAFWDVFYEHCNYFTRGSLKSFFSEAKHGLLFDEQYQYILADINKLVSIIESSTAEVSKCDLLFNPLIDKYKVLIDGSSNVVVWGAGAKGSTFLNLIDPKAKNILGVVDINSKKQGRYVALTGHRILSPEELRNLNVTDVIVMNDIYINEISEMINNKEIKLHTLG